MKSNFLKNHTVIFFQPVVIFMYFTMRAFLRSLYNTILKSVKRAEDRNHFRNKFLQKFIVSVRVVYSQKKNIRKIKMDTLRGS